MEEKKVARCSRETTLRGGVFGFAVRGVCAYLRLGIFCDVFPVLMELYF
jgi:hypothetical protein